MAKLYLIGNAHLDPVWLWRWKEGFAEILATYRSALERMKDFDDFKFTSACAGYYEWVEKVDPDMFEEIRQRVAEGRWSIVGGWYIQPDCNIPAGESFARHALISQRYFKEKFGVTAKTGYNVDSFGHNASMPKILKNSGMDNYVFMRPMPHEKDIKESFFKWESDDGSQVNVFRIPHTYCINKEQLPLIEEIQQRADAENQDYMAFYGVGNHGGGPTIELIDAINGLSTIDAKYSTPDEYFAEMDKSDMKVVHDELQHHARGCYTACSFVKQSNRNCENNLLRAETFSVMANRIAGSAYPQKKLTKGWKNVLFNQFHDILGGCSIKDAYTDAGYTYGETMSITEQAINFAMQSISRKIDTLQGEALPSYKGGVFWKMWGHEVLGTPVVVFNPYTWPVAMPVYVNGLAKKMTDVYGNEIPFQIVRGQQTNDAHDKNCTAFLAEVPPMGYTVYRAYLEKESESEFVNPMSVGPRFMENDKVRVEFDAATGDICRFYDKENDKELIGKTCKAVLVDETSCDTWAHDKIYLGETVGRFGDPVFRIVEEGPVRAKLRVITSYGNSALVRDYMLTAGSSEVKVAVKADFHEKHKLLKFTFPMTDEKVIAQIPYGTIERVGYTGEEPFGSWMASGDICVANDAKYGYDTENGEMRMSVLRGAIYADHFGVRDDLCEYMDMGIHEFNYSIFPYTTNADAERRAQVLNFGLQSVTESFHTGTLPEQMSCYECNCDDIVVTAVKKAEDSDDVILRFNEWNGKDTAAKIHIFDKDITCSVAHHELKTVDENGREVNLMEW